MDLRATNQIADAIEHIHDFRDTITVRLGPEYFLAWPNYLWGRIKLRLLKRFFEPTSIQGFDVYASPKVLGPSTEVVTQNITDALELLKELDPRRYRRALSDMPRIVVLERWTSCYWVGANTCVLSLDAAQMLSTGYIASVIVHEATHARLDIMGVTQNDRNFARVERRCHMEEAAFVELLPEDVYRKKEIWLDYLRMLCDATKESLLTTRWAAYNRWRQDRSKRL